MQLSCNSFQSCMWSHFQPRHNLTLLLYRHGINWPVCTELGIDTTNKKLHIDNTLPLSWNLAMLLKITKSGLLDSNKFSVAIPLSYPGATRRWCRSTLYVNLLRVCTHITLSRLHSCRTKSLIERAQKPWAANGGHVHLEISRRFKNTKFHSYAALQPSASPNVLKTFRVGNFHESDLHK